VSPPPILTGRSVRLRPWRPDDVDAVLAACQDFDGLGLRRVELVVDPANTGSRRVAERAGFRAEGVLRQRSIHRGRPVDDVVYGLLATDPR
jgi:RimJ/RimL family protein N-acetyltransferase